MTNTDVEARAAQWVADSLPSEARQIVADLLEALREKDSIIAMHETAIRQWREKLEQPEPSPCDAIYTVGQEKRATGQPGLCMVYAADGYRLCCLPIGHHGLHEYSPVIATAEPR